MTRKLRDAERMVLTFVRILLLVVLMCPLSNARGDDDVLRIQVFLSDNGYDPGPADGIFGPQTSNAIKAFERSLGREPTGELSEFMLNEASSVDIPPRLIRDSSIDSESLLRFIKQNIQPFGWTDVRSVSPPLGGHTETIAIAGVMRTTETRKSADGQFTFSLMKLIKDDQVTKAAVLKKEGNVSALDMFEGRRGASLFDAYPGEHPDPKLGFGEVILYDGQESSKFYRTGGGRWLER